MSQPRIERLMNLVAYLSDTLTPKTSREIIETIPGYPDNFDSARRAFERDKEELRSMNFDIAVEHNPNGDTGYRINKESTYYDVDLSAAQRNIVQYALELYGPQEQVSTSALTKLGGMNPENEVHEVTPLALPQLIDEMYVACSDKKPVDISFRGTVRRVLPRRLIARGGYWYFETFDASKDEMRTFRADRITQIVEASDDNTISLPCAEDSLEVSDIEIIIRVHPQLKEQLCNIWGGTYEEETDTIRLRVPRQEIFTTRIHEYSGFVTIVSPQEVVDQVRSSFASVRESLVGVR